MELWKPENPDQEPVMFLKFGEAEIEATRVNTHLIRYMGELALFDLVRVYADETQPKDWLIFNHVDGFDTMAEYMAENDYPMHLNQTVVLDDVERAFYRSQRFSMDNITPDDIIDVEPKEG